MNNEGLSKKSLSGYLFFDLFYLGLCFCQRWCSIFLGVLTAFIVESNSWGQISTKTIKNFLMYIIVLCLLVAVFDFTLKVIETKLDKLHIRILKDMSFDRYQYILKEFTCEESNQFNKLANYYV